jgi:hypothetical protein
VAAPSQRRALGALFTVLTAGFAFIAVAALAAGVWVVGLAAAALAAWLSTLAWRGLRPHKTT